MIKDPSPSADDLKTADRLYRAGDFLGIQLLDSLIIGKGRYVSMQEREGMVGWK